MNKTIKMSVAAAVAALAGGNAFALVHTSPIDAEVFVGGATAQDPGFLLITRTICQNTGDVNSSGGVDIADLNASPNTRMDAYLGIDNQVYTCLSNANLSGVAVGTRIAIYKTSIGGSGTGVIPIARQITTYSNPAINVRYLPVPSALPAACTGNATFVGAINVGARVAANYISHGSSSGSTTCGAGTRDIVPQVGISDVEPIFIDGAVPSDPAALTTTAVNHGIFGWAVSEPLRNALQAAQGLVPCTVARGDASRELTANQPSLARGQIAAIASGNMANWNSILARGSNTGLYDYVVANGGAGCPLPATLAEEGGARTFLVRRVPSSGTQAITEIWTLKQRCESGVAEILPDLDDVANDGSNTAPTFDSNKWVQAYSSSSGVRNGLDRASGVWALQADLPSYANDEVRWAIGNLSCENQWAGTTGNSRAYRFVKIDGAMPGLRDVANGSYSFYAEQVVNKHGTVAIPAAASAFHDYLASNLADPDVLRTVNAGFAVPGTNLSGVGPVAGDWLTNQGQGCLLGVPNPGVLDPPSAPITATAIGNAPVNTSWKRPSGNTNNCQDPVTLYPTPVGGRNQADAL